MSYILNALKKSEQERLAQEKQLQESKESAVKSGIENIVHQEAPPKSEVSQEHQHGLSTTKLFLLLFAAMILAGVMFALIQYSLVPVAPVSATLPTSDKSTFQPPSETPVAVNSLSAEVSTDHSFSAFNKEPNMQDDSNQEQEEIKEVSNHQGVKVRGDDFDSPPYHVLKRIPTLEITGHVFSSIPEKRSVTMNGRVWREGQPIRENIHIDQITPQGLILEVDGWPLVVGRSQGWQELTDADTGN